MSTQPTPAEATTKRSPNAARAFGIIAVAAGTHDGPVDFRGKPIVVRGVAAGTTIIQGSGKLMVS